MPPPRYTEREFRAAVSDPGVRTIADLCRALELVPRGANYETLRMFGIRVGIDVDHVLAWRRLGRTERELRAAVKNAGSMNAVLARLGVRIDGRIRQVVRQEMHRLGLPECIEDFLAMRRQFEQKQFEPLATRLAQYHAAAEKAASTSP